MKKRINDGVENKPVWHGMLALYYYNMRDSELAEGGDRESAHFSILPVM